MNSIPRRSIRMRLVSAPGRIRLSMPATWELSPRSSKHSASALPTNPHIPVTRILMKHRRAIAVWYLVEIFSKIFPVQCQFYDQYYCDSVVLQINVVEDAVANSILFRIAQSYSGFDEMR